MPKSDYDRKVAHSRTYRRTESHTLHVDTDYHGIPTAACTGCRWSYSPTLYERRNANPLLNVLDYHHWLYHIENGLFSQKKHG